MLGLFSLPFLSSSYAKASESSNSFPDAEAFLSPPSLLLSLLIKMWADDDLDLTSTYTPTNFHLSFHQLNERELLAQVRFSLRT